MEVRKLLLISSVLVIWIISGNLAHTFATGRAAKILEEPIVPQDWNYEIISGGNTAVVQDTSDRSLQVENNMMLYRSLFTLSIKLLSVFLLVKLLSYGLSSAGLLRSKSPVVSLHPSPQLLYTVDVNHNPLPSTLLSQTSTGAASGASTGGGAGIVPSGGYITAATNQRPKFVLPRFRFGGPRHPPRPKYPLHSPTMPVVSHHNMGEETHLVETHSHVYVMPDGSQARIPLATTTTIQNTQKPAASQSSSSSQTQVQTTNAKPSSDSASSASSTSQVTTEKTSGSAESVSVSTSSSSTSSSAERRSSNVFKDKQHPIHHQHYDDWNHFNPGTRSL